MDHNHACFFSSSWWAKTEVYVLISIFSVQMARTRLAEVMASWTLTFWLKQWSLYWTHTNLPLKNTTFLNFLGNMGYMSVKDENFPRAQGVLRGKLSLLQSQQQPRLVRRIQFFVSVRFSGKVRPEFPGFNRAAEKNTSQPRDPIMPCPWRWRFLGSTKRLGTHHWCILPRAVRTLIFCQLVGFPY